MSVIVGCNTANKTSNFIEKPQCLSSQSVCFVESTLGKFDILFDKAFVRTEENFAITLKASSNKKIMNVEGVIEGVNMFMGKIPVIFEHKTKHDNNVKKLEQFSTNNLQFEAQTMLGSCSQNKMKWLLKLKVTYIDEFEKQKSETLSIEFESMSN